MRSNPYFFRNENLIRPALEYCRLGIIGGDGLSSILGRSLENWYQHDHQKAHAFLDTLATKVLPGQIFNESNLDAFLNSYEDFAGYAHFPDVMLAYANGIRERRNPQLVSKLRQFAIKYPKLGEALLAVYTAKPVGPPFTLCEGFFGDLRDPSRRYPK